MNAPPKRHPTEQTLSSYGLGKLGDGLADAVNQHLEQCPDCRKRVAEMSADSFLERVRDARGRPASPSPVVSSLAGLSMMAAGSDSLSPPKADTLPPGLADHPDYKILRELGQGGMGVVYLAENTLMGRKEVLKVVSSQLMNRGGVLDRFRGEIRHAARLHHPNVVTAYSVLCLGESLVLAMEYVEGLDLARLVKARGPLPVANACNYLHQAALGLQHAHENGMVHRDIKPGNLMLSREGSRALVKVLDFGLAKVIREGPIDGTLTHEGQMLGTPDYIAPEQIVDARQADIRADIYSLGCTFYYLLTGGPPFQATSLYEIFQAHHSMDAMPLNLARPEVPVELAALVARMMAKEPNRRFQVPREVAQALKPFFKAGNVGAIGSKAEVSLAGQSVAGWPASGTISTPAQPATDAGGPSLRAKKAVEPTSPEAQWECLIDFKATERSSDAVKPKPTAATGPGRKPSWLKWLPIAAASLFGFIALGIIIYYVATDKGRIKIVVDGPQPIVKIDGETVRIEGRDETITLRAGPHELVVQWGDGEPKTQTRVVRRGDDTEWHVEYEPKPGPDKPPAPPVADSKAAEQAGWATLFNGKDLTGWVVDSGEENAWQAKDEELVVRGLDRDFWAHQGYLLSERDFSDFHLRLQFQRGSDTAESGIALRAVPHETARNSRPDDKGDGPFHLTVIIGDYDNGKYPTGTLWWSPDPRVQEPLFPDRRAQLKPFGEWNDMEVELRGQSLRIAFNGREVQNVRLNRFTQLKFPAPGLRRYSGRIGFLKRNSEVRFRRIEIKELGPAAANGVPANPSAPKPLETIANTFDMKLILIPAGEFKMGSPDSYKQADGDERPQHLVRITRPFYLGKYEVTQGQYRAVMNENPSCFKESDDLPVESVFWLDAIKFCNKLSEREGRKPSYRIAGPEVSIAGGDGYRLPTEAEWEYACRAGSVTVFPFGDDAGELGAYAWYDNNAGQKTHPVGRKRANGWGLHDMLGNVLEWCGDSFDEKYYASSPVSDPAGATKGLNRVIRGGAWYYGPHGSRPADRWSMAHTRFSSLGFRVVLVRASPGSDAAHWPARTRTHIMVPVKLQVESGSATEADERSGIRMGS